MRRWRRRLAGMLLAFAAAGACLASPAVENAGKAPARRIVTMAPHLAELVYAAGAGERLVGVVEFSDFPPRVAALPRIGDAFRVDYEAVVALKPDLILAWTSGNPPEIPRRLCALGFRVHALDAVTLEDIGRQIAVIGGLAGTAAVADAAAARYAARLARLRAMTHPAAAPRVFVQVSQQPYFTVTDRHFIGQGLRLCGGRNVFGELPGLTAVVSLESVIEAAPGIIVASDIGPAPLDAWRSWKALPAVRDGRLYIIDADLLSRPGERILDGIEALCAVLGRR